MPHVPEAVCGEDQASKPRLISARACNRVRLTCTGTLYMCLGQEDAADLRAPLRASEGNDLVSQAVDEAIGRKPKGHDFVIDRRTRRVPPFPAT